MKKEEKKDIQKKEGEDMAAISKPQEAMIISQGMTKSFIDLLASQKRSKDYWSECSSTAKTISSSTMDRLKRICNEEE